MKIALITDTHFGARNDSLAFNEYFYKFWEETFFPYIEEHGIDTVIHLGDVMDRRKFVSYKIAQDFRLRFMQRFVDMGVNLHMLVGNHDTFYKNTNDVNSLSELVEGKHPKVFVYPSVSTVEFDGTPLCLVPWICADNYAETMQHIKDTKAQVALGHFELNGFEMHAGHFAEDGMETGFLNKFDTVFSGHFHKKSDNGHVYYLGNTYQMTWSDDGCPKGFHVFDTETRELDRIVNPHTIFEKVYYDDSNGTYDTFDVNKLNQKFVKIVVVNKKDFYQFDRFIDKVLTESGAHEIKIVEDFSELDAENVDDEIIQNAEDTMSLLERYIEELDMNIDKKRLTNMMKGLYLEASDLEM